MKKTCLLVGILLLVLSSLDAKVNENQAKYKTIKYKSQGYAISGNVAKNEFVKGEMEIFSMVSTEGTIPLLYVPVNYKSSKIGTMLFRGTYSEINGMSCLTTTLSSYNGDMLQCVLRVGNMGYNKYRLTPNPKDAKSLDIDISIENGSGTMGSFPVFLEKDTNDGVYNFRMLLPDCALQVSIPSDEVNRDFCIKLKEALLKQMDDFKTDRFSYVKDFRVDMPWSSLVENTLKNKGNIKIIYENGDVFVGSIKGESSIYDLDGYTPNEGRYEFKSGEIYEGKFNIINGYNRARRGTDKGILWFEGVWIFNDGKKEEGYWPQKYGVDRNDEFLQYEGTPTEVHNLALKFFEAKQQKQREDEVAKAQEVVEKEKRKREYINRYGSYYGSLLSEGRLELGMTEEMVCQVVSKEYYVVSKRKENQDIVETWVFSQSRMERGMFDQVGAEGLMAVLLVNELSGGMVVGEYPKVLTFTNGKLSEIDFTEQVPSF